MNFEDRTLWKGRSGQPYFLISFDITICLLTQKRREHHEEAGSQVDVDGLDVGDLWQGCVRRRHEGGHGEHSGHSQTDSGRSGASIQPEADPGDDDDEGGGDVDLDQVVAHGTDELDLTGQPRVVACKEGSWEEVS